MSEIVDLTNLVHPDFNAKDFFAHTALLSNQKPENLFDHTTLTYQKYLFIKDLKNLDLVLNSYFEAFGSNLGAPLKKLFENAIPFHDIGKINPNFQVKKMSNHEFEKFQHDYKSNHSLISSSIYIDYFSNDEATKGLTRDEKCVYYKFLYGFAYQISKHHGYLDCFDNFVETLKKQIDEDAECERYFIAYAYKERLKQTFTKEFLDDGECSEMVKVTNILKKTEEQGFSFYRQLTSFYYVINKFLFSLIIASDHLATSEYYGICYQKEDFKFINDIDNLVKHFHKQQAEFFENNSFQINVLRNQIFREAEQALLGNLDKRIFYLEAPTGGGKTNTSINLTLALLQRCRDLNKIFYIFPFNTLIEQTKASLEKLFSGSSLEIAVVNSLSTMAKRYKETTVSSCTSLLNIDQDFDEDIDLTGDQKIDYDKTYLDRKLFNYELVLTSHVVLFNILFGRSKDSNYPLWQIANSVIVLDEIQCYRNDRWKHIIQMLSLYAEVLNIKIIIMSATLPQLDELISGLDKHSVRLIEKPQKYFSDPVFKDRVNLDFSLLGEKTKIDFEDLYQKLIFELSNRGNKAKVLFEFIKKDTARDFFYFINDRLPEGFILRELTGDDNAYLRKQVIKEVSDSNKIIIVATQVIEAGLDIDMDLGFKNISILDSEEQFLGRINRSCFKQDSIAYFFFYDDARGIYKKDKRIGLDLRDPKYQKCLLEKNFNSFYQDVFSRIHTNTSKADKNNFEGFLSRLCSMDFKFIEESMKLIEQRNFQLFFPFIIDIQGAPIDGEQVWQEYKKLNSFREASNKEDMGFAERSVRLNMIQERMQYFTYKLIAYDGQCSSLYFTEQCGDYFYIQDWENFISLQDGYKFDRKKYQEFTRNSIFL